MGNVTLITMPQAYMISDSAKASVACGAMRARLRKLLEADAQAGVTWDVRALFQLLPHIDRNAVLAMFNQAGERFDLPVPGTFAYYTHRVRVRIESHNWAVVRMSPKAAEVNPEAGLPYSNVLMSGDDLRAWTRLLATCENRFQASVRCYQAYFTTPTVPSPQLYVIAITPRGYHRFTPTSDPLAALELRSLIDAATPSTVCGECGMPLGSPPCMGCGRMLPPAGVPWHTEGPPWSDHEFAEFRGCLGLPRVTRPVAEFARNQRRRMAQMAAESIVKEANDLITRRLQQPQDFCSAEEVERFLRRPFVTAVAPIHPGTRRPRSFRLSTPPESDA